MTDYRFPGNGVDNRFPGGGVDNYFDNGGRFVNGQDMRFTAPGIGIPPIVRPTLSSAAVNGTSLALTFSEAMKTTNLPPGSAFVVLCNGVARSVSSLSVSGSVVTLVLATGAAFGETVTVAYTDPTTGDDTDALQSVDGRDVASFGPSAVTNNTPNSVVQEYTSSQTVNKPTGMRYLVAEAIGPGGTSNGNGAGGGGAYAKSALVDMLSISSVTLTIPGPGAYSDRRPTKVDAPSTIAQAEGGGAGGSAGSTGGQASASTGSVKYDGGNGAGGGTGTEGGGGAAGPSGPGGNGVSSTPGAGGGSPAGAGGSGGGAGNNYGGGSGAGSGLFGGGGWVRLTWTP